MEQQYSEPKGGMLIRDMVLDQRPREKAIKYGIRSLSEIELMAIIFGTGMRGKSVLELANEMLLQSEGHISRLARLSVNELCTRFKGIGQAKAISLLAALELGTRAAADEVSDNKTPVTTSKIAVQYMQRYFHHLPHEEFWVLLLNQSNRPITAVNVGRGGVSATAVDVRLILKHAIDHLASSMLIFHNHPSGNLNPSPQDDALTRKIAEAAKLLDIRLLDHIILTDGSHYSYQDESRL